MFTEDYEPESGERRPCHRVGCPCTHQEPCDRGWINTESETNKVTTKPCPTCDPDRAALFRHARNRIELMELLRNRSKHNRIAAADEEEVRRTRTM